MNEPTCTVTLTTAEPDDESFKAWLFKHGITAVQLDDAVGDHNFDVFIYAGPRSELVAMIYEFWNGEDWELSQITCE